MYVNFDQLSPESRIWVYQSDKPFTEDQEKWLSRELQFFANSWNSHGNPLTSSYQIRNNQFIIIGVEGKVYKASGCSIDKSVELIKTFEKELSVTLLDRSKVMIQYKDRLQLIPFKELKATVESNILTPETLMYNNTITQMSELANEWIKPAKESWLSKYFNK